MVELRRTRLVALSLYPSQIVAPICCRGPLTWPGLPFARLLASTTFPSRKLALPTFDMRTAFYCKVKRDRGHKKLEWHRFGLNIGLGMLNWSRFFRTVTYFTAPSRAWRDEVRRGAGCAGETLQEHRGRRQVMRAVSAGGLGSLRPANRASGSTTADRAAMRRRPDVGGSHEAATWSGDPGQRPPQSGHRLRVKPYRGLKRTPSLVREPPRFGTGRLRPCFKTPPDVAGRRRTLCWAASLGRSHRTPR